MTQRAAIPTIYKGVQFRSRLEARWAAFFDGIGGLEWTYEPRDLAGYVPDFVIHAPRSGYQPLMLEVKGCDSIDDLRAHTDKLVAAGVKYPALLVGTGPLMVLGVDWPHPAWMVARPLWFDATYALGDAPVMDADERRAWAHACNSTQYKSPRNR